jgi:hypothetical protein
MKKEQGSATITVIMAVMVLAVIGGSFAALAMANMKLTLEFQSGRNAQYAAEAGARAAIAMFGTSEPNWNTLNEETEVFGFTGAYYKVDISPQLTGTQLPAPGHNYQVRAIGRYGRAINFVNFTVAVDEEELDLTVSAWR